MGSLEFWPSLDAIARGQAGPTPWLPGIQLVMSAEVNLAQAIDPKITM